MCVRGQSLGLVNYCYVTSAFLNILSSTKRFQMTFWIVLQGSVLNFNAKGRVAKDSDLLGRAIDGDEVKSKKSILKRNSLVTPHFLLASYAKERETQQKSYINITILVQPFIKSSHWFSPSKKKKSSHCGIIYLLHIFSFIRQENQEQ